MSGFGIFNVRKKHRGIIISGEVTLERSVDGYDRNVVIKDGYVICGTGGVREVTSTIWCYALVVGENIGFVET